MIINKVKKKEYLILSINNIIDLIMKEEDDCFCENVIGENNLDVIINNGIIDSTTYNGK
jgi:hypothetical protein